MKALLLIVWASIVSLCCVGIQRSHAHLGIIHFNSADVEKPTTMSEFLETSFYVGDNGGWFVKCPNGVFPKSSTNLIIDEVALTKCLEGMYEYQKEHPNQKWLILGYYTMKEKNHTKYDNLGEARASRIKDRLINEFHFFPSHFQIEGRVLQSTAIQNNYLYDSFSIVRKN